MCVRHEFLTLGHGVFVFLFLLILNWSSFGLEQKIVTSTNQFLSIKVLQLWMMHAKAPEPLQQDVRALPAGLAIAASLVAGTLAETNILFQSSSYRVEVSLQHPKPARKRKPYINM